MTFRQILAALWRRRWIILALTLLAAVVAVVYVGRMPPNYSSSATVRLNPIISQAASTGQLGGVSVDLDPSLLTSESVLGPAEATLGLPAGSLQGAIVVTPVVSTTTGGSTSLVITGTATSAQAAKDRADAVVASATAFLDSVVSSTTDTLDTRLSDATNQATTNQAQVAADPRNSIAASNLASALSTISALNTQISTLRSAGPTATVTTAAVLGASTNPSALTVGALALLCGLIAGLGIALIRDYFDDRLRDDDDLESLLSVPVVGVLANDRRVARKKERLPSASAERTALSEGIRSLRTSVQVLLPDGKGTIVLTSVEPGDGKTFVSANLALSWAKAGRTVVLVGGDMRRPQLHDYFDGVGEGEGLGELLAVGTQGSVGRLAEALRVTPFRGLRILPAGHDADEPADLLASDGLEQVMSVLAQSTDVVVVDTPPAYALADASELAMLADGVIVIVSVGRTKRQMIVDTVEVLKANGANVMGIVVNRSRRRLPKSYASYYASGKAGSDSRMGARSLPVSAEQIPDVEIDDALAGESSAVATRLQRPGRIKLRRSVAAEGAPDGPAADDVEASGERSEEDGADTIAEVHAGGGSDHDQPEPPDGGEDGPPDDLDGRGGDEHGSSDDDGTDPSAPQPHLT